MANVAKISESAKASKTSKTSKTSKAVTPKATNPTFEDKTPKMMADPQYCWDLICKVLGADEATPRDKRGKNIIDRQFYGIARSTTLALLCGGQDTFVKRVENLDTFGGNKLTSEYVSDLLEKGYPRQAVTCVVELCILTGVKFHPDLLDKFYLCTEEVKNRGELLGAKILDRCEALDTTPEDADAFVRRFSSSKISDKKLLEYIKDKGVTYDEAVTALSEGGQKMRLDFEELKKLGIYEINYTSQSAVKDYVYFIIK